MSARALQAEIEATLLRNAGMVDDQTAMMEDTAALRRLPDEQWPVMVRRKDMVAMLKASAANLAQILAERTAEPGEVITDTVCEDPHHSIDPIAQLAAKRG